MATCDPGEGQVVADTTDDHQWLHVDPERAASGPFGTTIAHGCVTLSLATAVLRDVLEVPDARQVIDCGLAEARFPAPVPSGSQVRAHVDLTSFEEVEGRTAGDGHRGVRARRR